MNLLFSCQTKKIHGKSVMAVWELLSSREDEVVLKVRLPLLPISLHLKCTYLNYSLQIIKRKKKESKVKQVKKVNVNKV